MAWQPSADPGTRTAMADPGTRAAMADPGFPWAMAGSPNPPKKCVLGKSNTSGERLGGAGTLGHS